MGRDWKSKGAQADGRTIYLLAFRKVWFVSGWLFMAGVYSDCLLNIQSIFSTLGYVPHVSETTALDLPFTSLPVKQLTEFSAPLSFRDSVSYS